MICKIKDKKLVLTSIRNPDLKYEYNFTSRTELIFTDGVLSTSGSMLCNGGLDFIINLIEGEDVEHNKIILTSLMVFYKLSDESSPYFLDGLRKYLK